MEKEIFLKLKNENKDVYFIGQHKGLCEKPYVVVSTGGNAPLQGSFINEVIDIMCYAPIKTYTRLGTYVEEIKTILDNVKGIYYTDEQTQPIIDNEKEAYMVSFFYSKYNLKRRFK